MGTRYEGSARERRALDAFIKLMRCADTIEAHLKRRLARRGLTLPQLAVLEGLLHLGPLTQGELCRKVMRSGGSVTSVVDTLSRKGLVRRERHEDDRRVRTVHLTARGRRLIARLFPEHAADIAEIFSALTAADQELLGRLCRNLGLANAEDLPPA